MVNTRAVAAEYRLSAWAQIIQERHESGLSINEYCKGIGICQNTYFYWQRKVRAAACEQLALSTTDNVSLSVPRFAEVRVTERSATPEPFEISSLHIEISGIHITTDSTYPTEKLAVLLRELART